MRSTRPQRWWLRAALLWLACAGGVGRTGVVAEAGPLDGPTVGLRVDMDALPVEERTGLPLRPPVRG